MSEYQPPPNVHLDGRCDFCSLQKREHKFLSRYNPYDFEDVPHKNNQYPRPLQTSPGLPPLLDIWKRASSIYSQEMASDLDTTIASSHASTMNSDYPKKVDIYITDLSSECTSFLSREKKSYQGKKVESSNSGFKRALTTRNACIFGLVLAWIITALSLSTGIYLIASPRVPLPEWLKHRAVEMGVMEQWWAMRTEIGRFYWLGHRLFPLPQALAIFLPLLLNIVLTLVFDSLSYIHTTTQRWALWHDGKLDYNSNLRLFSNTTHAPTRWYANIVSAIALIFAYGGSSVLAWEIHIKGILAVGEESSYIATTKVPGPRYGLNFNGYAITGLGASLFIQASLSTWCLLYKPGNVLTWSSHPLATLKASMSARHRRSNFTGKKDSWIVARTRPYQPSAISSVPQVKWILRLLWTVVLLLSVWVFIVAAVGVRERFATAEAVEELAGNTSFGAYWVYYCQIGIKYSSASSRKDWLGFIVQSVVQSPLTLGLHCLELLINLGRDEKAWRETTTARGANMNRNSVLAFLGSWQAALLVLAKAVIHWVFGYAFSCNEHAWMTLIPLVTLTGLLLILVLFGECIMRKNQKGPQPAAYGNLHMLAEMVDNWGEGFGDGTVWWGDKGEVAGVRRVGTGGMRLASVEVGELYAGVRGGSSILM
ncbi:hypothetical protein K402DRAFT_65769 [Aulographum hederae CBS 113979]|uniref:Uncharacterized protein n=1 Tax=Aulographum hederae CBS 113979 TaxID=1176131 RepID=A0A6G1H0M9_9PEZI|nr:hypothetical protein K402DRAFT_65769 [Aulographum hederae CBS 113979]